MIMPIIASAGHGRALLERGDADISFDLPSKDFAELKSAPKLTVIGTPIENAMIYLGMNVNQKPFDNVKVRQAVAWAVPYQQIMDTVMFGQAIPLFGGADNKFKGIAWPQKDGYSTNLDKAKALMVEAGYPNGLETTLSFDLGAASTNEPLAILVQESLAKIGIKTTINKVPAANWPAGLLKKNSPLIVKAFCGWLKHP